MTSKQLIITSSGRLGNILFHLSAAFFFADRYGYTISINPYNNGYITSYIPDILHGCFSHSIVSDDTIDTNRAEYHKQNGQWMVISDLAGIRPITRQIDALNQQIRSNPDKNVILSGYFQSDHYLVNVNRVLSIVDWKHAQQVKAIDTTTIDATMDELRRQYSLVVGVSVRRGDYLAYTEHFLICNYNYFSNAVVHIAHSYGLKPSQVACVVCTDDDATVFPEWAKVHNPITRLPVESGQFKDAIRQRRQETHSGHHWYRIQNSLCRPELVDLWVMQSCDSLVISNSSFSWWGAWLNPKVNPALRSPVFNSKSLVIAPHRWFTHSNPVDNDALYCRHWLKMDALASKLTQPLPSRNGSPILVHSLRPPVARAVAVCLTYRRFGLLCEAVQSFLDQTYDAKFLIIVNDDPDSPIWIDTDLYPNVLIHNHTQRFASHAIKLEFSRKLALGHCGDSDYVFMFDDDDLYFPTRLEDSVAFLSKNSQYDMAKCTIAPVLGDNEYRGIYGNYYEGTICFRSSHYRQHKYDVNSRGTTQLTYEESGRVYAFTTIDTMFHVYRWGMGIPHLSFYSDQVESWNRIGRAVLPPDLLSSVKVIDGVEYRRLIPHYRKPYWNQIITDITDVLEGRIVANDLVETNKLRSNLEEVKMTPDRLQAIVKRLGSVLS
jgi:glycosyltransferase involved in cell wall biosynthesis